jgi:hypothetical protein
MRSKMANKHYSPITDKKPLDNREFYKKFLDKLKCIMLSDMKKTGQTHNNPEAILHKHGSENGLVMLLDAYLTPKRITEALINTFGHRGLFLAKQYFDEKDKPTEKLIELIIDKSIE